MNAISLTFTTISYSQWAFMLVTYSSACIIDVTFRSQCFCVVKKNCVSLWSLQNQSNQMERWIHLKLKEHIICMYTERRAISKKMGKKKNCETYSVKKKCNEMISLYSYMMRKLKTTATTTTKTKALQCVVTRVDWISIISLNDALLFHTISIEATHTNIGFINFLKQLTILETAESFTVQTTNNAIAWAYVRLPCNRVENIFNAIANWITKSTCVHIWTHLQTKTYKLDDLFTFDKTEKENIDIVNDCLHCC